MATNETLARLTDRFGPINEPIDWYGINENGIGEALEPLPHIINRQGVFADIPIGSSRNVAVAYVMARLINGRSERATEHWAFGADQTDFGVVATVGEIAVAEELLGKSFEQGKPRKETGILKASFVSPTGLLATIRQAVRGKRGDFIVNRGGFAEIAVQEMLPEAQATVAGCLQGVSVVNQAVSGTE